MVNTVLVLFVVIFGFFTIALTLDVSHVRTVFDHSGGFSPFPHLESALQANGVKGRKNPDHP